MVEPLLSVVTQCPLPAGAVVGAMPSPPGSLDHLVLIGLRCVDVRPPGHNLKVDPRKPECPEAPLCSEWLLHVQSARDGHEQNLEAVAHEGRLYARTTRPVKADEELLLWYGPEVGRALGIPGPNALLLKGESKYSCPFCSEVFLYPNPCSAHVIYRCDQKRPMPPLEKPLADSPGNCPRLSPEKNASAYTVEFLSSSSNHSDRTPSKTDKTRTSSHMSASSKRKTESRHASSPDPKRVDLGLAHEGGEGGATPDGSSAEAENQAPLTDHNQNVKSGSGTSGTVNGSNNNGSSPLRPLETGSAFKKVHKGGACLPMDVPASSATTLCTLPFSATDAFLGPPLSKTMKGTVQLPMSIMSQAPTMPHLSCPAPGLFPPPSMPSAFAPAKGMDDPMSAYGDAKIVVGVMDDVLRLPRVFPDHHPHPTSVSGAYKLPLHYSKPHFGSSGGGVEPPSAKFSMPPPVASLLPPSLTALGFPAQNWCAKCNASFRMTSDLVYHMRSHHKREIDPAKKRRDEKLKCQICNESFRERHHLTRHMTSHQ